MEIEGNIVRVSLAEVIDASFGAEQEHNEELYRYLQKLAGKFMDNHIGVPIERDDDTVAVIEIPFSKRVVEALAGAIAIGRPIVQEFEESMTAENLTALYEGMDKRAAERRQQLRQEQKAKFKIIRNNP